MEDETGIGAKPGNIRQSSVGWMLKRLCASLDADMSHELKPHRLNINQFAVIMTLLEQEGLTQAEIGKKIDMPGYSTTRTMDALEEKHIVERRRDERSRRSHRIYLTSRGRALAPELFSIVKRVNGGLLAALSGAQTGQLTSLLAALLRARL